MKIMKKMKIFFVFILKNQKFYFVPKAWFDLTSILYSLSFKIRLSCEGLGMKLRFIFLKYLKSQK